MGKCRNKNIPYRGFKRKLTEGQSALCEVEFWLFRERVPLESEDARCETDGTRSYRYYEYRILLARFFGLSLER